MNRSKMVGKKIDKYFQGQSLAFQDKTSIFTRSKGNFSHIFYQKCAFSNFRVSFKSKIYSNRIFYRNCPKRVILGRNQSTFEYFSGQKLKLIVCNDLKLIFLNSETAIFGQKPVIFIKHALFQIFQLFSYRKLKLIDSERFKTIQNESCSRILHV